MEKASHDILNNYWVLLKSLSTAWKLELIERLTQSVRQDLANKPTEAGDAFGSWEGDETAEEIIQGIRESRYTNRQTESF